MSVYELLAPKKNWTELVVKSVTSDINNVGKSFSVLQLYAGNVTTITSTTAVLLTPEDIIGGVYGIKTAGNVNITFPTSAQLDAAIDPSPVVFPFIYFIFKVIIDVAPSSATFFLGSGTTFWNGDPSPTGALSNTSIEFVFARTPLGWKVYDA